MTKKDAILRIYHDRGRKPLRTIVKEVASYCISNKETPSGYVNRMLYRKSAGDPRAYIANSEGRKIHLYQRNRAIGQFFANKVLFYFHLSRAGLPLPKFVGYNVAGQFCLPTTSRSIAKLSEFRALMEELMLDCPRIFVKPALGAGGANIFELTRENLDESVLSAAHEKIVKTSYIFQERVCQHSKLDAVYAGSVNSMRVMTWMQGNSVEVLSAVIRFGAGGNFVDNVSNGGMFVGIDLSTGKLEGPARQYLKTGGHLFTAHPDSGVSFADFTVPCFTEVMETAKEGCRHLPYKLIGWDIAVAEDGPVILEANDWPNLDLVQIAYGGYKSHPTFGPFVEQILGSSNGRRSG